MKLHLCAATLSFLVVGILASAIPARAGDCKSFRAVIVDAQTTAGCTSPRGFCAAGTVDGIHGFRGTTFFTLDGVVAGPATAPGTIATSGVLVYTTARGTLTVRESGMSNLVIPSGNFFTAFQQVLSGTGDYADATGRMYVLGQNLGDHFEAEVTGELCRP